MAATMLAPTSASAESKGLITVGLGTTFGVNNVKPLHTDAQAAFTTELSFKLKALHVFGLEFSYAPTDSVDTTTLVYDSTFRVSGLLYIVPTYPVNFYLKGGIGAGKFTELFSVDGPTNSYHAGAGLDVHVGDHWVIGAEFLLLLPGIASVKNTIESFANTEIQRFQTERESYRAPEKDLSVADFVSIENFRVSLSARYYF